MIFNRLLLVSILLCGLTSAYSAKLIDASKINAQALNLSHISMAQNNDYGFSQKLGLVNGSYLKLVKIVEGELNHFNHYQQYIDDVPVENGMVVSQYNKDYQITQLFGQYYQGLKSSVQDQSNRHIQSVVFDNNQAYDWIVNQFAPKYYADQEISIHQIKTSQVVLVSDEGEVQSAYKLSFFIDAVKNANPKKPRVYLDAETFKIIKQDDLLAHAETVAGSGPGGNEKLKDYYDSLGYDGEAILKSRYQPEDVSNKMGTFTVNRYWWFGHKCGMEPDDQNNVLTINMENRTGASDNAYEYECPNNTDNTYPHDEDNYDITKAYSPLNDAHYFGQATSNMFVAFVGVEPLGGETIKQMVHYGQGYDNAFWNGEYVAFGDGSLYFYPMTVIDVVSHEIAHGFTEKMGGRLDANKQMQAINEAFSDMAGEALEYWYEERNDFRHNFSAFRVPGIALRYFKNPTFDGVSIDSLNDYRTGMSGHHAAGIFNKAFYYLIKPLLGDQEKWNTKIAFKLFAKANMSCWAPARTFQAAADCVLATASEVAKDLHPTICQSLSSPTCQDEMVGIKNDIRKAFATVDIYQDIDEDISQASFSVEKKLSLINFTNKSYVPSQSEAQYHWDFGDGTTSSQRNPSHTYATDGEYDVSLTVNESHGGTDTYARKIKVSNEYCRVSSSKSSNYWIDSVWINESGSQNTGNSSYSDFSDVNVHPDKIIALNGNQNNSLSLTPGNNGNRDETIYWTIWIDKNVDGDFTDDGEMIYQGQSADRINTTVGAITNTEANETRMRVVARSFNYAVGPCSEYGNGEVEDYTVRLGEIDEPLITDFSHDANLGEVTFTNQSNNLNRDEIDFYWTFGDGGDSTETHPRHHYTENGTYTVVLKATPRDGGSAVTQSKDITVMVTQPTGYCAAKSTYFDYEGIRRVNFSDLRHFSGKPNAGYNDYTAFSANVSRGQSYEITLEPWFATEQSELIVADEYWRVWIDYNQNFVFEESEMVVDEMKTKNLSDPTYDEHRLIKNILVKQDAELGETRMRIAVRYPHNNQKPPVCGEFGGGQLDGGEVEDYTIAITE